jgi:hypothetical protein
LDFITEVKSVYSAVRTGSLNKALCASPVKGQCLCFIKCAVLHSDKQVDATGN